MINKSFIFSLSVFFLFGCSHVPQTFRSPGKISNEKTLLPNGWMLSPAGTSIALGDLPLGMSISPDKKHALVVNSGQSIQMLSVINIEQQKVVQTLLIKRSWMGVRWNSIGDYFFVTAGNDNAVYRYGFEKDSAWFINSIKLGKPYPEQDISPTGVDVNEEGSLLFVATKKSNQLFKINAFDNTLLDTLAFSSSLYSCVLDEKRNVVYVSLWGESKIAIVDANTMELKSTIGVGDHPTEMVMTKDGKRLFVANANNNTVSVIDLDTKNVIETIWVALSPDAPNGSTPNSLAFSDDEKTLYVANADNNFLAVLNIAKPGESHSLGFIPTGWYPTAVRCVGNMLLVANGKGESSKANPKHEYIGGLLTGTLSFIPVPTKEELEKYTAQVFENTPLTHPTKSEEWTNKNPIPNSVKIQSPIKHVFYIIKENRTYDQVFGDMQQGNGDSSLCLFGKNITPNHHAIAEEFVLLDNFYADAEVSADGHNWSTAAYATDYVEKTWPTMYGGRGGKYDFETEGIASPTNGYIWDNCLRHNVSFRNYGEFLNEDESAKGNFQSNAKGLKNNSCPNYRGWDLSYPDRKRVEVWMKEFDEFEKNNSLPQFTILRLPNDHTAGTRKGVPSPRAMVADNDYALGMIVERISKSSFWKESAIFVIEDDAQNGADHVDAHRTVALVVSPFTKRKYVDHTMYSTSGMMRTMELILSLPPMSQFDASATPMYNSFTATPDFSPYILRKNIVNFDELNVLGAFGQERMEAFNLKKEDSAPDIEFNQIIWKSIKGTTMPAPVRGAFVKTFEKNDKDDD